MRRNVLTIANVRDMIDQEIERQAGGHEPSQAAPLVAAGLTVHCADCSCSDCTPMTLHSGAKGGGADPDAPLVPRGLLGSGS